MKDTNIKLYAKALAEVASEKMSQKNQQEVIGNFLKLLEKKCQLKNAKKIIDLAEAYYIKQQGNKKVVIESARQVNLKLLLKTIYKQGDIVQEKISPGLIAGIKITLDDEMEFDASLSAKIRNIL